MTEAREAFERYKAKESQISYQEIKEKYDEFERISGERYLSETMKKQWSSWLASWQAQQKRVDELQKKNAWLSDVACRENKRANKLQEEKVNTTGLLGKTIQEKNHLQKRVDAAQDALTELEEKSEALHHRWYVFSDTVALAESEMIDMCVKELEQALKCGES